MRLREFAVALQAFVAVFLCGGMAWMIFVMAGFNPTPPTIMDLQLRSTKDVSYASMNSTAAALAVDMIAQLMPSPIVLPPTAARMTNLTPTLSLALIPISGPSQTLTPTPVSWFSSHFPTRTRKPADTKVPPTVTFTFQPTGTNTAVPTLTQPPTETDTPIPPTSTTAPPPTTTNTEPPPTLTPTEPPPTLTPTTAPTTVLPTVPTTAPTTVQTAPPAAANTQVQSTP